MENSLGGPAVGTWIVQHALPDALRCEDWAFVFVVRGRERENAGKTRTVEYERRSRKSWRFDCMLQIIEQEILDALVHRTEVARKRAIFFTAKRNEAADEFTEPVIGQSDPRLSEFQQFQIEIGERILAGTEGRKV